MNHIIGQERERPFPSNNNKAKHKIDNLENRDGLDENIEGSSDEVPRDLWPEEPFNRATYLDCGRNEYHQARPVIMNELTHRL
jgi:hypothetical protein